MKYNSTWIRGIALLLLATLLLGLCPSVFADDTAIVTHIKTVEDLNRLAENCRLDSWSQGRTVSLDADIALDGADFSGIPSFGGTFQGNGHTISGLSLSGKASFAGLFRTIQETGTVKNLNVSGSLDMTGNEAVGGIAAFNYGAITGCSFSGSVSGDSCVGSIVGTNELLGSILNCTVTGDKMTGGIVGKHQGLAVGCTNTAYVNTTQTDKTVSVQDISIDTTLDLSRLTTTEAPTAATDMGGIAGYSTGVIRECENTAAIGYPHVGYNVGGIAGRSCGYIVSCQNSGSVYGRKDIGGIAGQMEPYMEMTLSKDMLSDLQQQLADLNALVDKAADDAENGANGISDQMNAMSGYVQSASSAANNISVVIDAGGSVTGDGDTYSVTAAGAAALEIISLLLPQTAGSLVTTQQLYAQLTLKDNAITNITVSAEGMLSDDAQTTFSLSASMDDIGDQASFVLPQAVLDAADSAEAAQLPAMTEDLMNLMTAWYQWNRQDSYLAEVSLTANCGPVVINDQLELSSAMLDGTVTIPDTVQKALR